MTDWKGELLDLERERGGSSKTMLDRFVMQNPEKGKAMLQLLDDYVQVRKDGARIPVVDLVDFVEKKIGLRTSAASMLRWLKANYPDDISYLKW